MYLPEDASDIFDQGYGTDEIVRRGVLNAVGQPASSRTARRWKQEWRRRGGKALSSEETALLNDDMGALEDAISYTEDNNHIVVSSTSSRITTLEQLLRESKVDLSLWEVDRYVVNKWEGYRKNKKSNLRYTKGKATGFIQDMGNLHVEPLIQIKVWLVRKKEAPVCLALEDLILKLKDRAPRFEEIVPSKMSGDYLFVPSLFDVHFNRRSVDGDWTLKTATETFINTGRRLLSRALVMGMPVERIMFPVGNDSLQADNLQGTTTKGTWQDIAADQRDAVEAMCAAHFELIEYLALFAPVDVVVVGSNHDRFSTFWLGMTLEAWFHKHQNVTVDTGRRPRKYYRYGNTLLGLDHGDNVKPEQLGLIMAHEASQEWARTQHREWLRGHIHTRQQMYYQADEKIGVSIRMLPALCPSSEWETLLGLVGNQRAGEGLFYHREYGPAGSFPIFVGET